MANCMKDRITKPMIKTAPVGNTLNQRDITIWDGVVRLCHWGLVVCFITNYFIVEPGRLYHEIAGYSAVFFITVRVIWGLTRPPAERSTYQDRHNSTSYDCHNKEALPSRDTFYDCHNKEVLRESNYASFRGINISAHAFKAHIQHLKYRNVPVQTGHNPFGWLMIFAVIGLFVGLGITGFLMEEIDALFGNSTLEWMHSIFADVLYACVLVHIAAVFFVQYRGRIQLLRPMIIGLRRDLRQNNKP